MAITQTNEETNIRPTGEGGTNQPQDTSGVLEKVSQQLLDQSGLISSQSSNIEQTFTRAIEGVRTGQEASARRIESEYGRKISEQEERGVANIRQLRRSSGLGVQMAAFRDFVKTTDTELKDLGQRKEELLLQGDANAALQISQLEVQSLQYKQQAEQQVFNNLLGIAGLEQQTRGLLLQERQQEFVQSQAIGSVALEFGLDVEEGESLESIIARAAPLATGERNLRLQQIQEQINASRATASSARAALAQSRRESNMTAQDLLRAQALKEDIPELAWKILSNTERNKYFEGKITQKKELMSNEISEYLNTHPGTTQEEIELLFHSQYDEVLGVDEMNRMISDYYSDEDVLVDSPYTIRNLFGGIAGGFIGATMATGKFLGIDESKVYTKEEIKVGKESFIKGEKTFWEEEQERVKAFEKAEEERLLNEKVRKLKQQAYLDSLK